MAANDTIEEPSEPAPPQPSFHYDWNGYLQLKYSTLDTFCSDCRKKDSLTDRWSTENNFFKNVAWSPDGTSLLSNSADNALRLFNIPSDVFEADGSNLLSSQLEIYEAESVYDFVWYPGMNFQGKSYTIHPSTCAFLTSVRDHPIRLRDSITGEIRASYVIIDHRERVVGPNTLCFNLDGSKIYAGYDNRLHVFDTNTPGKGIRENEIATTPTRKSKKGQKGIISCLSFNPDMSGVYAAGSYGKTIGLYDERNNKLIYMLKDLKSGVTQVRFSNDGQLLYSASRKDDEILCWDIRKTSDISHRFPRPGNTNQRITFDIDASGQFLVTGDQHGNITTYDLHHPSNQAVYSARCHEDIVSATAFHPFYPLLASCSGQRKYRLNVDDTDSEDDSHPSVGNEVSDGFHKIDNSIRLWQVPGEYK